jgi:sensor histidine kinase regulating citrate/malate metabolism
LASAPPPEELSSLAPEDALHTAKLSDAQRRRIAALERRVADLREQVHEHANRLHAVAGLLVLQEPEAALALLQDLMSQHLVDWGPLEHGWPPTVLTAMLNTEILLARQRAIALDVEHPNELSPTLLTDAQVVTIVGNLLDNAREAVAEMPPNRRRILVVISEDGSHLTITVRDWGRGLPQDADWFARGVTSRPEHAGVGLALVRESVTAAHGEIAAITHEDGAAFVVRVPLVASQVQRAV